MSRHIKFLILLVSLCIQPFSYAVSVADIDGTNGVAFINDLNDFLPGVLSQSGSIGDINGDGIGDYAHSTIIIDNVNTNSAQIVVVFGSSSGFVSPFNFTNLQGSKGFRIVDNSKIFNAWLNMASAGDLNGDGIDDLVLTHSQSNPPNERVAIVIYGRQNFPDILDVNSIDGSNGFIITDSTTLNSPSNRMFVSQKPVDINCDGFNDLLLGAPFAGVNLQPGTAFVVYGDGNFSAPTFSLDSLDGINGFNILAPNNAVNFGFSFSGIGDFNGDGCGDLAVGDLNAPSADASAIGRVQVIFGNSNLPHPFISENVNGSNGLSIRTANTPNAVNGIGTSISGGDFDGDGFSDVLMGSPGGTGGVVETIVPAVIVKGSSTNPALITVPFQGGGRTSTLIGFAGNDTSNPGLLALKIRAGDVNGDGLADVIIDGVGATHDSINISGAGIINVAFGMPGGFPSLMMLPEIENNSDLGFIITGITRNAGIGRALEIVDINGDGVDDIVFSGDINTVFPAGSADGAFFMLYGTLKDLIFTNGFE
jgi:hypothetical protein